MRAGVAHVAHSEVTGHGLQLAILVAGAGRAFTVGLGQQQLDDRRPANKVLQPEVEPFLTHPVGRPPRRPIVWQHDFLYDAKTWGRPRRAVAKIGWHLGELFPRVGFIVTNCVGPPGKS